MLRPLAIIAVLAISLGLACGGGDGNATATIVVIGGDEGEGVELTVELARTAGERSRGLMLREELAEDGGMLFVFPGDTEAGFWMKDTLIPLSIAFIAEDGTILDIQEMEPLSEDVHRPPEPYRYALEVNQGWFEEQGFGTGDRVEIPEEVTEGE
jgi:hypothetical protein